MALDIEIVEELSIKPRGNFEGIGSYNRDKSEDLGDMNYAERLVTAPEVIRALATLKVMSEEKLDSEKRYHGRTILLTKEQIATFRQDAERYKNEEVELASAATMINKVFVALQIPFFAKAWASDNAQEVEKVGKRGKKEGVKYTSTPADKLRINRISETFNIDNYFADKSSRVLTGEVKSSHQPTDGMIARGQVWMNENAAEFAEELKAFGLEIEEVDESEKSETAKPPLPVTATAKTTGVAAT